MAGSACNSCPDRAACADRAFWLSFGSVLQLWSPVAKILRRPLIRRPARGIDPTPNHLVDEWKPTCYASDWVFTRSGEWPVVAARRRMRFSKADIAACVRFGAQHQAGVDPTPAVGDFLADGPRTC